MPFLPLFIVIGIFLATSKILQSDQQQLQSADDDYNERILNQALIDYIAREARHQSTFDGSTNVNSNAERFSLKN